jgi:Transposase and inactivated derivatives
MTKYSSKFKTKIVREYLDGGIGLNELQQKYQIAQHSLVSSWVKRAQVHGMSSLKVSHHSNKYSQDYKISVVDYIQTHEVSRNQAAIHFGISNSQANSWMRIYQEQGVAGLRPKPRRRRSTMSNHKNQKRSAKRLTTTKEEKYKQQIIELKRQLHDAELDRDILKALATITKQQLK